VTDRRRASARPGRTPPDNGLQRQAPDQRQLLDRILDTPHLAQVVPRLQPELLHRVIQRCGLEDCAELVALATPEQLARVFDLDLWGSAQPGRDEQFDADRFGVWLEVLVESGAALAAQKLAEMDVDLVIGGFAQHVRVFDRGVLTRYTTTDGEEAAPTIHGLEDELTCDVGGYVLVARRTDSWDAIVAVLTSLDEEHHDFFHQVMRGCRTLSNARFEIDGLHDLLADREQAMFDLSVDREGRRETQGYLAPAQARAFLEMSRRLRLESGGVPPANPIAHAYFRVMGETTAADVQSAPKHLPAGSSGEESAPKQMETVAGDVEGLLEVLLDAGILAQQPRALLAGSQEQVSRLARIHDHMRLVLDRDSAAYAKRSEELAFLANTLMAGCSIQARPFTAQEASDGAVAICNLGLENWPAQFPSRQARHDPAAVETGTALPDDFLVGHDLVGVFQVGWTVLHDDVSMYSAAQLIEVLTHLQCGDGEIQAGLDSLCLEMGRHSRAGAPWRARDALDVIASLDLPAWAVLLGLIDECPVIHAGIAAGRESRPRAVSASAFEFISENSQIASVREFMQRLPEILRS
jgi:Family of unknown function (DUF6178)